MGLVVVGLLLLALEPLLARVQLGEVDRVRIEIRPVDAGELHLAADRHAARSAHAGAVDHHRVQRHHGAHAERARRLGTGVHHRHRADRHDQLRRIARQHVAQGGVDEAGSSGAAVVGAHDQLVAELAQLVGPEHELGSAEADDAGDPVAGLLEGAQLRKDRRHAQAAADQHHVADLRNVLRQPERAGEIGELVARGEMVAHLAGGLAQRLHHDRDGAALAVEVGDGQWNALARFIEPEHDEMAGLRGLRDIRRIDFPQEGLLGKLFVANDADHRYCSLTCGRRPQAPASSRNSRCTNAVATWRR